MHPTLSVVTAYRQAKDPPSSLLQGLCWTLILSHKGMIKQEVNNEFNNKL